MTNADAEKILVLSKTTKQDIAEQIVFVKNLFEIARMTKLLCEEGHLDLQDANEMARQTSQLGMMLWKHIQREFPENKDNQKIDRGEHVVFNRVRPRDSDQGTL